MGVRLVLGLLASLVLAGCSGLPSVGPSARTIESTEYLNQYAVIDISANVISALKGRFDPTFAGTFGTGSGGGGTGNLTVGDLVKVTIWEASSGGLFSSESGVNGGSKSTQVPEQRVSRAGTIFVPYAGELQVAGRSTEEVQNAIIAGLDGKAIEPQALVTVTESHRNSVTVVGEGSKGGRISLTIGDDRLLDVIAASNAMAGSPHETFIQYTRGNRTLRVPMETVLANPKENIFVRAGDTITLLRDPQSITVFGASGKNAEVPFPEREFSLAQAIATAGGLIESRSDAEGVFVFRREPRALVEKMSPDAPILKRDLATIPVIYRIDLSVPTGTFLARDFRVYDKDVLYVSTAPATELLKFLNVLSTIVGATQDVVVLKRTIDNL